MTPFPTPRQLFWLLAAYFCLQVIIRVTCSTSTDLDESEAVILAQRFTWGYGSDPPLYTWLQIPFFAVLGQSVLGLSVLKNLLLFGTYWLTFAAARMVTRSKAAAVAAALSLFFLPRMAWESQRDLTHSVLSATMAAATLWSLLRLVERRRISDYLLFGVCAGLGILSKYNYAFWPLGLLLAGVSIRELRPAVLDKRIAISAALTLAIFLPNGLWMLNHRDLALLTSSKFNFQESLTWFEVSRLGLKNVFQSLLAFVAPVAAVYALVFFRRPRPPVAPPPSPVYYGLILRAWVVIGATLVLLILFAHATGFKERWFQPILIALPIAAMAAVQRRLDRGKLRVIFALSLLVMAAVAVIMPGRLMMAERLGREEPLTRPYAELAAEVRPVVPEGSLIVCETRLLAGNLRLGLQDCTVVTPELVPLFGGKPTHAFLAWEVGRTDALPESLRDWASEEGANLKFAPPRFFQAKYMHHHTKERRMALLQLY